MKRNSSIHPQIWIQAVIKKCGETHDFKSQRSTGRSQTWLGQFHPGGLATETALGSYTPSWALGCPEWILPGLSLSAGEMVDLS